MNPNNEFYKYRDQLNDKGKQLVMQFMLSKEYKDLRLKIARIEADLLKAKQDYFKRVEELHREKYNVECSEIPKAKDEYVRQHIEGYKMHLRTKDADNPIEAYMQFIKSEVSHG